MNIGVIGGQSPAVESLHEQFVNGEPLGDEVPTETKAEEASYNVEEKDSSPYDGGEPTVINTDEGIPVEESEGTEDAGEPEREMVQTEVTDGSESDDVPGGDSDSPQSESEADSVDGEKEEIDFSGKSFEETQKALNISAKTNTLNNEIIRVKEQRDSIVKQSFKEQSIINTTGEDKSSNDVIQYHLDRFTFKELEKYLEGKVTDAKVQQRIDEFFENPDTHEILELSGGTATKTKAEEYDFKRSLLLYFKQNDDYLEKIDEELEKLNQATEELNENISEALNPLKDNILAYSEYLVKESEPAEGDTPEDKKRKRAQAKKARAIRSGYTLENMIELIEKNPKIKENALRDFHNEDKLRDIGERYAGKLRTAKIDFDLFPLLSNDPHDSVEYQMLPQGEYPAGLEGFTVFFIIRSLGMSLPNPEDVVFHASIQVSFTQLLKGDLDKDVAETVKKSIKKFLDHFA
jgi:hypothetical protein